MKIFVLVVTILFVLYLMAPLIKQFFDLLFDRTAKFHLTKITFEGANIVFSQSNNTVMQKLEFLDNDAKGKFVTALYQLAADAAGNMPVFKTLLPASTNEAVAVASLGNVDAEKGTYELKMAYTGKNGSADCSLTGTNADDTTVTAVITSLIDTEDVTAFGEPVVSALQS